MGVQFLRFSSYLSRFILGKEIDYSALQVVVGWINEALKVAPSGFDSIVSQAKKLDGIIRLSSGWCFYDIWNAFLTDVVPSSDCRPVEMLERVSSRNGNAGKRTFLEIHVGRCQLCSDLRNQAFQFAALCTLPAVLSRDEVKVVQDLKERFQKVRWTQFPSVLLSMCRSVSSCYPFLLVSCGSFVVVLARSVKRASNCGLRWGFHISEGVCVAKVDLDLT